MKKMCIYFLTILISAFIPIYFFFIWEPLKSAEVMTDNLMEGELMEKEMKIYEMKNVNLINGIFNNIEGLSSDKKEKINSLINELSILDIIKVNSHLSDLENKEEIKNGFSLLNKRMSKEKYEELRGLIYDYINLE